MLYLKYEIGVTDDGQPLHLSNYGRNKLVVGGKPATEGDVYVINGVEWRFVTDYNQETAKVRLQLVPVTSRDGVQTITIATWTDDITLRDLRGRCLNR